MHIENWAFNNRETVKKLIKSKIQLNQIEVRETI